MTARSKDHRRTLRGPSVGLGSARPIHGRSSDSQPEPDFATRPGRFRGGLQTHHPGARRRRTGRRGGRFLAVARPARQDTHLRPSPASSSTGLSTSQTVASRSTASRPVRRPCRPTALSRSTNPAMPSRSFSTASLLGPSPRRTCCRDVIASLTGTETQARRRTRARSGARRKTAPPRPASRARAPTGRQALPANSRRRRRRKRASPGACCQATDRPIPTASPPTSPVAAPARVHAPYPARAPTAAGRTSPPLPRPWEAVPQAACRRTRARTAECRRRSPCRAVSKGWGPTGRP